MFSDAFEFKDAMNAVSDIVENRPRPIRAFDQIYMKSGDILRQCLLVSEWSDKSDLAFIGDGDGISIAMAHLMSLGLVKCGPKRVRVFDFDERIVNSVNRFCEREKIFNLTAERYNCVDPFPENNEFTKFYTNPPWGQSNGGESVNVFAQRGMEAIGYQGEGMIVVASVKDHKTVGSWPKKVMYNVQQFVLSQMFFVSGMILSENLYHLDDEHRKLPSCNLIISSHPENEAIIKSHPIDVERLERFYGATQNLRVRYINETARVDYGSPSDTEYSFTMLEQGQ